MLSLAKARKDYYLQKLGEISPREDYYLKGGTATGQWHGRGAASVGLSGTVSAGQLVRMFDGEHPQTGEQLGRRLREGGVAAWDLTFSADKSVSLLWALGDTEIRQQVLKAFEEANTEALAYLESVASDTRGARKIPVLDEHGRPVLDDEGRPKVRVETWPIKTEGYIAAWFTEFTSRELDPQLHTHVVVANRVKGVDGVWRTLDARYLYRHKLAAGCIHEAELRKRLTERLGVRWQPVKKGMADVEGFTRDQITEFSQRRQQIDEWRSFHDVEDTPANNALIALATRAPKERDESIDELRAEWLERAATVGLTQRTINAMLNRGDTVTIPEPDDLFTELGSERGLTREKSTFGRADTLEAVAAAFPEGATRQQVETLADTYLCQPDVVPIINGDRCATQTGDLDAVPTADEPAPNPVLVPEHRYTTAGLLATEQRIINRAIEGIAGNGWKVTLSDAAKALADYDELTEGQRRLVAQFATSGNRVEVGVGAAGTGKSTALSIIRQLADSSGAPIYGTAVAAKAATGFESTTGIPSTTLTRLIGEARDQGGLPERVVLVVDEAGMVGTRQLAQVSDLVHQANGKLILIGDHHQLPELEAGGLFRALAARLPAMELSDNVRQRDEWERAALNELRRGSVTRALAMYRNRGRINTAPTPAAAIRNAVAQWEHDVTRLGDISQVLLIAHENSTVETLNRLAREALTSSGTLQGSAAVVAGCEYQAGDRVVCLKNRPRLGVLNGDLATITSVDPERQTLTIRLDRNRESRSLPSWYLTDGHLDYGYAITGHKAQGATARIAHAVTTGSTDREWVYVTMSRGKEANTLHLVHPGTSEDCSHLPHFRPTELEALTAELGRRRAQSAAIDSTTPAMKSTTPRQIPELGLGR